MLVKKGQWTGAEGESYLTSFTNDGTNLYAGLYTNPTQVVKINASTMATISKWTGTDTLRDALSLYSDGTYVYVGGQMTSDATRGRVTKIDPSDMSTVASWDAQDCVDANSASGITGDGTYIYVCLQTDPNEGEYLVVKLDPSDMSYVASYNGDTQLDLIYPDNCWGICYYSGYVYVTCQSKHVMKIDISDMTVTDHYYNINDPFNSIAMDNAYVYAASRYGNGWIRKIDISDMTLSDSFGTATDPYSVSYASPNVHVAIVSKLYSITASGMDENDTWAASDTTSFKYVHDFGGYTYFGTYANPAIIHKLLDADVQGPFPTHFVV